MVFSKTDIDKKIQKLSEWLGKMQNKGLGIKSSLDNLAENPQESLNGLIENYYPLIEKYRLQIEIMLLEAKLKQMENESNANKTRGNTSQENKPQPDNGNQSG